MGRIDLSHESSSPSSSHASSLPPSRPTSSYGPPRATISHGIASPPSVSSSSSPSGTIRKGPAVNARARVDMSSLLGSSASAVSPPTASVEPQPSLRRFGSATSSLTSPALAQPPRVAPAVSPNPPIATTSRSALSSPGTVSGPPVVCAPAQAVPPSSAAEDSGSSYITQRKDRRRAGNHSFDASSSSPIAGMAPLPSTTLTPAQHSTARQAQRAERPILRTHTRAATALASPVKSTTSGGSSRLGADGRPKPIARSRTPSPGPDQRLQIGPAAGPEARLGIAADSGRRRSSATLAPPFISPVSSPGGAFQPSAHNGNLGMRNEPLSATSSSGSSTQPYSPLRSPTGLPAPSSAFATYRPDLHVRGSSSGVITQPLRLVDAQEAWGRNEHSNGSALSTDVSEPVTPGAWGSAAHSARSAGPSMPTGHPEGTPFASLIETGLLSPAAEQPLSLTPAQAYEAAEARVRRRLEDLEITNKSLLSINEGLEKTRLKQAKEIRDYKRRLRGEGRYSVLPGALNDLADADPAEVGLLPGGVSDEEDEEEDDGEDALRRDEAELEATYTRCSAVLAQMLARGRAALTEHKVTHTALSGGGRVLHPIEMAEMEQLRRKRNAEQADDTPNESRASGVGHSPALNAQDEPGKQDFLEVHNEADASVATPSEQSLSTQDSSISGTATEIPQADEKQQDTPELQSAESSFVSSDGEDGASEPAEAPSDFVPDPDASID